MSAGVGTLYNIKELRFSYLLGNQKVEALRGISLDIPSGAFVCLSGPSGSGKTTLLSILGLIEKPESGEVLFENENLAVISEERRNQIRKFKIGFVFQNFNLIPVLTAEENVEYFLARQGVPKKERLSRVAQALEAVGLAPQAKKRPLEMSGGQRQRVAIARAIAKQPDVIIADEPTANLDQQTGREIMEIFRSLNAKRSVTLLLSSHDPMVQEFAPTKLKLSDGLITGGGLNRAV
jgi:putative ABC transport system ATP-binding protein